MDLAVFNLIVIVTGMALAALVFYGLLAMAYYTLRTIWFRLRVLLGR